MCNCSTWHNELDFECCCTCHGSSDERQNAANNHARRLCATIARLTGELEATKPCEPCQRDDHDNCTGYCSSMCCALAAAEAERDSLAASLEEARENLEESKEWAADREEAVRQYANSLTVARAELSELRARVKAAVARANQYINRDDDEWDTDPGYDQGRIVAASVLLAILAPPEDPTDKGEK